MPARNRDPYLTREEALRPYRNQAFTGPSGDLEAFEQTMAQGYSPEAANIAARHGIRGGSVQATVGEPEGKRWKRPVQYDFNPNVGQRESSMLAQRAAMEPMQNRDMHRSALLDMVDTRQLRTAAGQGVTREAAERARGGMVREGMESARLGMAERSRVDARDLGMEEFRTSRYNTDATESGLTGRNAATLALQERMMGQRGFQTDAQGNTVFQGPTGDVSVMGEQSADQRARTFVAKLREDLDAGRITQAEFDAEVARRSSADSSFAMVMRHVLTPQGTGAPAPGGQAPAGGGQAPIVRYTADGRKVQSTDGGKTFEVVR
jgi:hypothetical protein